LGSPEEKRLVLPILQVHAYQQAIENSLSHVDKGALSRLFLNE
jgi:hypothetical protein